MRIRICSVCLMLVLAGACGAWAAPGGEVRRISVVNLPLKSAPDGLSTTVSLLKDGDAVTVTGSAYSDASPPAQHAGDKPGKAKKAKAPQGVHAPRWLRVSTPGGEGYVPEGATVTASQFANQTGAGQHVGDTSGAGKGFSESEDPDIAAMKGAGGSAETGAADFAAVDKIVAAKPVEDEQEKTRDFRQTGRLGEFKQAEVHP